MAEHHPLGDIEYLRETLLRSYRAGFPIIKELIQNAEDANSTHLDFGWTKGLDHAEHPLLKSPALFFIDNGDFSDNNAKSIRYIIGGSSKPNQEGAIGKFGLGLKSVFHLCEAFFYLSPELEKSKYERCSIFNPWAGAGGKDEFHVGWDNFSKQDQEKIRAHLKPILDKKVYEDKWFILWIPLRQAEHKAAHDEYENDGTGLDYIVRDSFPDVPTFLAEDSIQYQIALLLPLLGHLSNICFWEGDDEKFQINLCNAKRQKFANLVENKENFIHGNISLKQDNIINYSGHEIILTQQCFDEIINSPDLPKKFKNIKPHCGVVFGTITYPLFNQSIKDRESTLSIRTSVFLPIGEDICIPCKSDKSYLLLLHGYFFVDSGRTEILGLDKETLIFKPLLSNDTKDDLLKKNWNKQLYETLLNRILYALNKFVYDLKISGNVVSVICDALLKSNLFQQKQNIKIICKDKQWVYRIKPNVNEWVLLDIQQKILIIPRPSQEVYEKLWQCFPGLIDISQSTCLSLFNTPNLTPNKDGDRWTDDEIIKVLKSVEAKDIFENRNYLEYITSFLKQNPHCIEQVQNSLCLLTKQALCSLDHQTVIQNKFSIQSFVKLINSQNLLSIDCNNFQIKRQLYILNLEILIIPQDLNITSNNAQIKYRDAEYLFIFIAGLLIKTNQVSEVTSLTKQILKVAAQHINQFRGENVDLKFIIGFNCQNNQYELFSLRQLDHTKSSQRLFKGEQANQFVNGLKDALLDSNIVLINSEIADLIYGSQSINTCNHKSCLELLKLIPKLNSSDKRSNLLGRLLPYV